jgi:hypothetical protein
MNFPFSPNAVFILLLVTTGAFHLQAQNPGIGSRKAGLDSLPVSLQKEVKAVDTHLLAPFKQVEKVPGDSVLLKGLGGTARGEWNGLLATAKSPFQGLTGGVKLFEGSTPFSVSKLSAEANYSYFQDTSSMGLGLFHSMGGAVGYNISYAVSLENMPFNMSILENNGINTFDYTPFRNFYKFNFDHDQYVQTLRAKAMEKINPAVLMNSALSRVSSIRHGYEQQLQGEIGQLQSEYAKENRSALVLPDHATDLSAKDMGALRNQMLPGTALQQYNKEMASLQQMIRNKDQKTLAADTNYHKTYANVRRYETMEKIYDRITTWQQRYQSNPMVKELLSQSPDNIKAYLSDPQNLGKVLDDQGSIGTIQKLFYNVSRLDMGQNAVQSGELSTQNLVNTGVNTEYKTKAASFGMIYGKNNTPNNWLQAGLTSQVTNQYSSLTGFKMGTGTGSPIDQSVALNFFSMNNPSTLPAQPGGIPSYLPVAPHQDGVITVHSGFQIGALHTISVDLSKSFGSFQKNVGGDSMNAKSVSGGSVFNSSGRSNYAAILEYSGEIRGTDIRLYGKKIGLGYNNPGNALLRAGESQLGVGLARKFMKQRITVKYDGDYRRQVFDPSDNYIYSAISNKWQLGFKLNRNDRFNLTYQRSDYHTEFYAQPASSGTNSRLQLDAAYRFTVSRKKIMNNLTISRQQISLPFTSGNIYSNNILLLTNTSSMMLKKNMISLTLLTNQSNNSSYYFNTSMSSAETNYSYTLAGNFRLSSGLGYYANYGWNRQVGLRQQVSAVINGKLNLDFQVAYKKAVRTIRPELADQLFVSSTIHYTFK